jgi:FKBP-type peptidyl-prolyl cis-trans isomerase 2
MVVGEVKSVSLTPEEAYGDVNPEAIETVPKNVFPPGMPLTVGGMVQGTAPTGQPVIARIDAIEGESVTLDMNHPLAGKNLNFEIELVSIENSDNNEENEGGE